jgi:ABC-type transporter Mla subunit MlaD
MGPHKADKAFMPDPAFDTVLTDQDLHPRILARRQFVALNRRRRRILTHFDQLIDSLERLSSVTDQFSILAQTSRDLRSQLANISNASANTSALLAMIQQHLADAIALIAEQGLHPPLDRTTAP